MGGVTGSLLIGAFASKSVNPSIMYEAIGPETTGILFGVQLGAMLLAAVYAFVFTILLVYITRPRLSARQQLGHIDYINHGEDAYAFDIEIPSEKEMEQYELADSS